MAAFPPLCPTHAPPATTPRFPMTRTLSAILALAIVVTPTAPAQDPDPKNHWAFKAPTRPDTPRSRDAKRSAWARNAIDHFVMAQFERENLGPSPEADKVTLAR